MRSLQLFLLFAVITVSVTPVQAQSNRDGSMPQYLFPAFSQSIILFKTGEKRSSVMNFNTVTEKLVFVSDKKYYDLMNPETIDTIYLNGCKFIPVGKTFYEVLLTGPVSLFIQHKGNLLEKGVPVGYGGTSQLAKSVYVTNYNSDGLLSNLELPEEFDVNISTVFWIRRNDEWFDFTTEKQYLQFFPDKAGQIKKFIKEFRLRIDRKDDLIRIVKYTISI